ncbi:MAG: hypothetical protein QF441_01830 [Bacteriovoracaceae bacterium]|jgi:predicted GNAT family acetyltransferase|nr:hypothetical protein [Halobacteriovoraceae bacterium]MDP7319313.1 hypothetical protein [Bacteriovoracaceae bacterium]|tara:strand:+ start:428 stop:877 length:450 start_codon:yes stop_codon:yes gene_type:complete
MTDKKIDFTPSKSEKEIKEIYNFNVEAFADSHDFAWTKENIKKEIKSGWVLYSGQCENEIVCAIFMKLKADALLTKNTPIKINFQGNGFSHKIKDFYEEYAKDNNVHKIYNYCPVDNFRMIALNEGHDYEKTGKTLVGNNNMIEWVKTI